MWNEKIQQGKTKNGLSFYIYPQKAFGEKMAAIVVKRGANHIFWKGKYGETLTFPQGTAHFIEHKLFQQEWGDAFLQFSKNGAAANAFTDRDKTVYYFTCREKFMENLKVLLNFVQNPYFTKVDTEQEKSIIQSEIAMYGDDPGWVAYYQMLGMMYEEHPIKNQISGTEETVQAVTAEILQKAYGCCYTTDHMALVCTGNISARAVRAAAETLQKRSTDACVYFPLEEMKIFEKYRERKMGLSRTQFQIGFKLSPNQKENCMTTRIAMGFLLEILSGESSTFFRKAYERDFLDEPIGAVFSCGEGYAFAAFAATGEYPEETAELFLQELEMMRKKGIREEDFRRIRKKMLGRFLRRLDSPISLCLGQIEWAMMDKTAAEIKDCIKTLPMETVEKLLQNSLCKDTMILSVVK